MIAQKISSLADQFPTAEVAYEDLIGVPHKPHARIGVGDNQMVDCLGVLLEIFRRAGIGLPDPVVSGKVLFGFSDLFDGISAADTLYDVVHIPRDIDGVSVVVRPGLALTSSPRAGVILRRLKLLEAHPDALMWRLKSDAFG